MPENKDQSVPLSKYLALNKKFKELESASLAHQNKIAELEDALQIAQSKADPEDVAKVKAMLKKEASDLAARVNKYNEEVAALEEGRRSHRAEKLAFDAKGKGIEIDPESLLQEEDMDSKVQSLMLERLAQENEELKKGKPATPPAAPPPASQVYEAGAPALVGKQPKDMSDSEFADYLKTQEAAALARK